MDKDYMAFVAMMTIIAGGLLVCCLQFVRRMFELRNDRYLHRPAESLLTERLDRIESIVETTALEVERISEANRFMSKLLAESGRGAIPVPKQPERVITPH